MFEATNKLFRDYLSSLSKVQGSLDISWDPGNRETNTGDNRTKFSRKMVKKIPKCQVYSRHESNRSQLSREQGWKNGHFMGEKRN